MSDEIETIEDAIIVSQFVEGSHPKCVYCGDIVEHNFFNSKVRLDCCGSYIHDKCRDEYFVRQKADKCPNFLCQRPYRNLSYCESLYVRLLGIGCFAGMSISIVGHIDYMALNSGIDPISLLTAIVCGYTGWKARRYIVREAIVGKVPVSDKELGSEDVIVKRFDRVKMEEDK